MLLPGHRLLGVCIADTAQRVKGALRRWAASGVVTTMQRTLPLLLAVAGSFLVVLGFVLRNEDLKFAGAIGLLSVMLLLLTRRLVGFRRRDR